MPAPLISVILPTRRRPRLLPRAVASVYSQTDTDFELIVVDDNPAAERAATRAALAPWRDDPRLRVIEPLHSRNCALARNAGLAAARGGWVTYLDDDDAYAPEKLAAQRACADRTGAPVVLCGLRYHLAGRRRVRQCRTESFAGAGLLLAAQAAAPGLFHRRMPELAFASELDAGEDQEFFLRLVQAWDLTVVPNVPRPLVEVYPQVGHERVNTQAVALWRAQRLICLRHAPRYGRAAQRLAVARAALLRERWRQGAWGALWRASRCLLAEGGVAEARLVANTWSLRVPGLRRLAVS